jgi:hypothetical protein
MAEASASAASTASAAEPSNSGVDSSKLQYLEQKYGSKAAHVHLSQPEVDAMVDKVLRDSPTVQYLLASLKMVGVIGTSSLSGCDSAAAESGHSTATIACHSLRERVYGRVASQSCVCTWVLSPAAACMEFVWLHLPILMAAKAPAALPVIHATAASMPVGC